MANAKPEIKAFFDEPTNTVSYLVWDPATRSAAVVDPVLDFDHKSGDANVKAADALLAEAAADARRVAHAGPRRRTAARKSWR